MTQQLIIGVGNPDRGDDAAGLMVARELAACTGNAATVVEHCRDGMQLLEEWRNRKSVWLIDAVDSDEPAGRIYRFAAHREKLPVPLFNYSSHALGVAEAVELARVMACLPSRLIVFGIAGKNFAVGAPLSPEVRQAVRTVSGRVAEEMSCTSADLREYRSSFRAMAR